MTVIVCTTDELAVIENVTVELLAATIGRYPHPNALAPNALAPNVENRVTKPARLAVNEALVSVPLDVPSPNITNAPADGAVNEGVVTLMVVLVA
jgi:hypothetical protein